MKRIKQLVVASLFLLTLGVPLAAAPAFADPVNLQCYYFSGEFSSYTDEGCDLGIAKQVSVNGGDYADADSGDQAATAKIGDTVTWKLTVTDESDEGLFPIGYITVQEAIPAGLTVTGSEASAGTYSDGSWTFKAEENLPATLLITTTVAAAGQYQNTATFTDYVPDNCDGPCEDPPYADANSANNSNSAFLNVAAPVVTTAAAVTSTNDPGAPNTGFGIHTTNPLMTAAIYALGASALVGLAYVARKTATQ
jgi:hypothetical protein